MTSIALRDRRAFPAATHPLEPALRNATDTHTADGGSTASSRCYPPAILSTASPKFDEPVLGIAVLDANTVSLDEATTLFELVTPLSTPLRHTHASEHFEAAADEETGRRRLEHEPARDSLDGSEQVDHRKGGVPPFHDHPSPKRGNCSDTQHSGHGHHRSVLSMGGCVIFSDCYLDAHPLSRITDVTNEFYNTTIETRQRPCSIVFSRRKGMRRLEEVRHYISEVIDEYRPLFRFRRASEVYGTARYIPASEPDSQAVHERRSQTPC